MDFPIRNPVNRKESRQSIALLNVCFPKMDRRYFIKRILENPGHRLTDTFIMTTNNRIISHAQVFRRNIFWANSKADFLGLGFICTMPGYRNKGYATQILKKIIGENNACLIGLFTKISDYYKKLGFTVVPRKKVSIIKRTFFKNPEPGIRIRKFNFGKDIRPLMKIHKVFFNCRIGIIYRTLSDWRSQLSYFNEEKNLFLVAEYNKKIEGYIRCKLIKPSNSRIEIVEFAARNNNIGLISDFIAFLFNKRGIDEIKSWSFFLKPAFKYASGHKEETDTKMMLRFNRAYRQSDIKNNEICFLESDGF